MASSRPGLSRPPLDGNTAASAGLPIKDEVDLAIEARAKEIMLDYDVSAEEAMDMARGDVLQNMDVSGHPTPSAALAAAHEQAGAAPDRARRLAEDQVRTYGPQGAWDMSQRYATPEGRAFLENARREQDTADARHQQMYDDYFRDTGAPSHQQIPAAEAARDEYRQRWNEMYDSHRRHGLNIQQPIDPGTPEQNARWDAFLESNPEQMQRFRPSEYAAMEAATRDKEMEAVFVNIRQRYGPDQEALAREAHAKGRIYVPQRPEQISRNERYKNAQYEAMGDGESAEAARELLRGVDERRKPYARARQLREAGLPDNTPEAKVDNSQLRVLLAEKRAAEKAAKDLLWKPRAMIRGGNAIGARALPGMGDWQQQAMAGGATPIEAEALTARRVLDMMGAEALAGMDPFNRGLQQQTLEDRRRQQDPGLAGRQDISRGNWRSDQGQAELRRLAAQHDTTWGGFSYQDEANLAATLMKPPYNMSRAEAEEAAYMAAQSERWSWAPGVRGGGRPVAAQGGPPPAPPMLGPGGGSKQ